MCRIGAGARKQQHRAHTVLPVRIRRAVLRSRIARPALVWSPPWSGWTSRIWRRYWTVTSRFVGAVVPTGKPSTSSAHAVGSASADRVVVWAPARWAINAGPIGPRHCAALCRTGADDEPACLLEPLDRVHRAQHLGEIGARTVEIKAQIVGVADHPVPAAGEPVAVDLEPVTQARLHDSVAALDLVDQAVHIGMQLVVDAMDVTGDDGAEQQPAETRRGVDGKDEVAERQAPGRHGRARVPQLELGEQHAVVTPSNGRKDGVTYT